MLGMHTSNNLYLKSEIVNTEISDNELSICTKDGRHFVLPLAILGRFDVDYPLSSDAQFIILPSPPRIETVQVTDESLKVYLVDGRIFSVPLAWFPRLLLGTHAERNHYRILGDDQVIHWPDLDEDIDLERLLVGGPSVESTSSLRQWLKSKPPISTLPNHTAEVDGE